jgi:hypothetical protein
MNARVRRLFRCLAAAAALPTLTAGIATAATITIVNGDGANEGFNDPTPVAPVGGNPATTLGGQRLYVFQYAAGIWGAYLPSTVEIRVASQFSPQTCDAASGVLGGASAGSSHRNFPNAPFPDTWYQQALANRLAGFDLSTSSDINITFNSDIGQPTCLPQGWYLGVDGNEGTAIELLPVVLHELGHGLGFATITLAGVQMGTPPGPHVYDRFIFDLTQQMHWNEMTDAQRGASAQNCNNVVWDGPQVTSASPARLGPKPILRVNAPPAIAGDYEVGLASFGPEPEVPGATGDVVLVNDGSLPPNSATNGCEPFVNAGAIAGNIAFVDRGGCTFATKVKNAQNAGAIGVIVADSLPGCPAAGMGGADPTITIPSMRLTLADGDLIRSQLVSGVNATLTEDPALKAGSDAEGRVKLYTVVPFAPGSSVSHFDISPLPHLLMEPAINTSLSSDLDLTREQMRDIGWFTGVLAVAERGDPGAGALLGAPRPNPAANGSSVTFRISRPEYVRLVVTDVAGRRIRTLHEGVLPAGEHTRHWDGRTERSVEAAMGTYVVVLRTSQGAMSQRLALVR